MCAVFITTIVGRAEVYKKDEQVQEWFGGVARSMYTLVEVMTGEWVEPARYTAHELPVPAIWIFFFLYLILTMFSVLNLIVGVIVENVMSATASEQ